jgi:hypothetical protein
MQGQNLRGQPGEITTIKGPANVSDIRALMMPTPFNPPSEVLFSLLQWLTDQAKGVVATATEKIADATSQMPVGTALALIEQGSVTFSSIHSRLHAAQKRALSIIHRLNAKYLNDEETVEELGELVVSRQDFDGPMDIEPVSDPNIFSDAQRYAQIQAVFQLSQGAPGLYKVPEMHRRALRLLKVPDPDGLLMAPKEPERLGGVDENKAAGDPQSTLKVYPDQDHMAHLKVHVAFMTSPLFGANPLIGKAALPKLLDHCKDHILALYDQHAKTAMGVAEEMGDQSGDAELLAEQKLAQMLAPIMPHLQQAMQMAQQMSQPPMDPKVQAAQIQAQSRAQELQAETQKVSMDAQADMAAEQRMAQADQRDAQLQAQQQAIDAQNAEKDRRLQQWETTVEMQTAHANAQAAALEGALNRVMQERMKAFEATQAESLAKLNGQIELILQGFQAMRDAQAAEQQVRAIPNEGADDGDQGNQSA